MIKKIVSITFILLVLSSCFWWDDSDSWDTGLVLYETEQFSLNIPVIWNVITDSTNILPKPSTWSISLAVSSDRELNGFSNNLIILSEDIKEDINSIEYSNINNVWTRNDYYQYKLLSENDIVFETSNISSKLYIFEARYSQKTPKVNFLQTAIVCPNNKWYVITIGLSQTLTDFARYENILKSFECRE